MHKVVVISNARAGRVGAATRDILVNALSRDLEVSAVETAARHHATELAAAAVSTDCDAVLVYGGDGTLNEAAQPLVGTGVALGILPGGSTNVVARAMGVPEDPVEAAALAASKLRSGRRRRISIGKVNERHFLIAAGIGLDGEVVKRVESDPEAKRRHGEWLFLAHALRAATHYVWASPRLTSEIEGAPPARLVVAVACNLRPLSFFKRRPVDACPLATLDSGLDLFGLVRMGPLTIPRLAWSLLVSGSHVRWRTSRYFHDLAAATVGADRPMPVQVDGDYIGDHTEVRFKSLESALDLLL